jgi:hypothetical protein
MSRTAEIITHCIPAVTAAVFIGIGFMNLDPKSPPAGWYYLGMVAGGFTVPLS